jgi:hypothetical protein
MPNPEGSQGRQWLAVTTRCSPRCSTTNPRPSPTVITVPLGFSLSAGLIALIRASAESSCAAFRILGRNHSWMWLPYLGCACPSRHWIQASACGLLRESPHRPVGMVRVAQDDESTAEVGRQLRRSSRASCVNRAACAATVVTASSIACSSCAFRRHLSRAGGSSVVADCGSESPI